MRGRRNTLTNKVRPLNLQLDLYDEPASMIVSDVIINIQDVEEDNNNNGGNTNAKSGFSIPKPELGLNMKDPLWSAVQAGNLVLLQDLLQNPIIRDEVTELGSEGDTILHLACHCINAEDHMSKHREVAKYIIDQFPFLMFEACKGLRYKGETPLHIACVKGDLELVVYMLERNEDGLDINELRATGYDFQMDDYEFDGTYPGIMYYGETVLSFAAIAGHTPIVKFLLESGANPGIADAYGNNTLHMLCYYGLFEEDKGSIYDESPYKAITRFLRKKEKSGDLDPFLVNLNFGLDDTDDETSSSSKKKSSLDRAKSVKSSAVLENTLSGKSTGLGPRRKSIQRMVPPSMARNRKGFTPFLLAVDRGHVKVLDTHKEVIWDFARCSCYTYAVHDIDTWQDPAKFDPDRKSALEIAVRNKDIDMIQHPIMDLILRVKWELYGRKMFISDLIKYLFLMVNTALVVSLLPYNIEERIYYTDAYGKFRIVLESITAISLLDIIIGEIGEVQTRGFRGYSNGFGRYENLTQWIYVLLKLLCVISRFGLRNADLESIFLGMASITGCMFLLFFAKGIPKLGPMVLIYYQMMTGDLIIWLTLYATVLLGFAQAFFLQMQKVGTINPVLGWEDLKGTIIWLFRYLFWAYNYDDYRVSRTPNFTITLFIIYAIATSILLLNLLIAILNKTVQKIYGEAEQAWKLQWATLVMEKDSKMENNPPEKCSTKDLRNGKSRLGVTFPRYDRDGQRIPDGDQFVFYVYDRKETDYKDGVAKNKRIVQKLTFLDPGDDHPNEVRVPGSVWKSWKMTKQAKSMNNVSHALFNTGAAIRKVSMTSKNQLSAFSVKEPPRHQRVRRMSLMIAGGD